MNDEKREKIHKEFYNEILKVISKYTIIPKDALDGVAYTGQKANERINETDIHISCLFMLHFKSDTGIDSESSIIQNCNISGVENFFKAMTHTKQKIMLVEL
ncbi:unnamed protein product, partial [marine sediment metagenome]